MSLILDLRNKKLKRHALTRTPSSLVGNCPGYAIVREAPAEDNDASRVNGLADDFSTE
ncbi:MAG: hypothetical protein ABIW81_05880 [Terrimesophilobacter sp.]